MVISKFIDQMYNSKSLILVIDHFECTPNLMERHIFESRRNIVHHDWATENILSLEALKQTKTVI